MTTTLPSSILQLEIEIFNETLSFSTETKNDSPSESEVIYLDRPAQTYP